MASRLERQNRERVEEWSLGRARIEKQVKELESNVKQAREMAFKRSSDPNVEELNRLRRQLEHEFTTNTAVWEEEKRHLTEKIQNMENLPSKTKPSRIIAVTECPTPKRSKIDFGASKPKTDGIRRARSSA